MELWIRSQNKLILTKVNNVVIDYNDRKKIMANYIEFNDNEDYMPLGEYDTEERALEVLGEIQNRLMPYSEAIQDIENITISYKNISTTIYEMPKK